jgi:hypothetical protein
MAKDCGVTYPATELHPPPCHNFTTSPFQDTNWWELFKFGIPEFMIFGILAVVMATPYIFDLYRVCRISLIFLFHSARELWLSRRRDR